MSINRLDHLSVRTHDVEATRAFYVDMLGLHVGDRPNFPFPGVWLYHGDKPVVHVIGIDPNDSQGLKDYLGGVMKIETVNTSAFDHIAFYCDDLDGTRRHLQGKKAEFTERKVPNMALHQIFIKDPNGLTVELNFPTASA